MNIVKALGFVLLIASPWSFAGMVTLDMEDFEYWDDYGSIQKGGRLSLQVDTGKLDAHPDAETGLYDGAILNGTFFNAYSSKEYCLDIAKSNSVLVDLSGSFYTGLSLKGFFLDLDGNSARFDLWLEGTYKADDRLDNLVGNVEIFSNATKFLIFGSMDYFDGAAPNQLKISQQYDVDESRSAILFLIGLLGLLVIRKKRA